MVNSPTFPYDYVLTNLPVGSYYVFGFLNTNPSGLLPDCPDVSDICGRVTAPVEVSDANPTATVDITLDIPGCTQ